MARLAPIAPRRTRPPGDGGFTLVELLIVLGIVALMAALAAPALGSLTGADARKAAGELAGSMRRDGARRAAERVVSEFGL